MQIEYSTEQQQPVITGEAYGPKGERFARWWSIGASLNAATLELSYFWKGDQESAEEDFSGVGYFRFDLGAGAARADKGTGWYMAGNIAQLRANAKEKVEIRRVSPSDANTMLSRNNQEKSRLAASVYSNWRPTFGRSQEGAESVAGADEAP